MIAHTVRGNVSTEDLGVVLAHEHLIFDLSVYLPNIQEIRKKELFEQPITLSNLGDIRRDAFNCRDNLIQLDLELAIKELMHFRRAGGGTLVDCTTIGLQRDIKAIKAISEATGVNIIAGTGYYIDQSHPKDMNQRTVEEIEGTMVHEITSGADQTSIKCGIIGEIGTSYPVTRNEEKVLRAAAHAQQKTHAPLYVHIWPYTQRYEHQVLDILLEEGGQLDRVVLCHQDETDRDTDRLCSLAKRGCFVEFDTFGQEVYYDSVGLHEPCDTERILSLQQMIRRGYVSQLLLSQDICYKVQLKQYGGYGYDHILTHIIPTLRRNGINEEIIQTMIVGNPKRLLGY